MGSVIALVVALATAGCAASPRGESLAYDPYIEVNRQINQLNVGLDRTFLRPITYIYDVVTPTLFQNMLSNANRHIGLPQKIVSALLMAKFEQASEILGVFVVNTVVGAGGLLNPAADFGLVDYNYDFGVVLAHYGAPEGPYIEVPILGPRTTRAFIGDILQMPLAPTNFANDGNSLALGSAVTGASVTLNRHRLGGTIDEIYNNSADVYISLRTLYLQNRRFIVSGGQISAEDLPDLFDSE